MSLQPWRKGKIIRIENETADTRRFWVEVPDLKSFDFKPGQFVTLDLPIHEKPNKRWRSYSIASAPNGTNIFELLIVLNPNGLGTTYMFNEWTTGSEITFRGPQGIFVLETPIEQDIFFICTGTGVAPFRSMLQHIKTSYIQHQQLYLVYGCRTINNLMYAEEMRQLENELQGFHYIPTLSREEWEGRTGYVHDIYEQICADRRPATFYLCGWKDMIDEAKARILQLGYEKKDIRLELYG
jgi:CDP-4-dehydro-6-deoxyglucose reductase